MSVRLLVAAVVVALGSAPAARANFLVVTTNGHFDIEVVAENGVLGVSLLDEDTDEEYEADEVLFQVGLAGVFTLGSPFDFLGNPGDKVWRIPRTPNPALPYLGFAGDELDPLEYADAGLRITAVRFTGTGPGHFAVWNPGDSGPDVLASTLTGDLTVPVPLSHTHYNLGFNGLGRYEVDVVPFAVRNGVYVEGTAATLNFETTVPAPPGLVLGLCGFGVLAGGAKVRRRTARA